MREVLLRRLDGATAEAEIAAAAGLADRVARERGRLAGALQIAIGAGDARDARALPERARRRAARATGGHAVFAARGTLGLTLLLPGPAAWLDEPLAVARPPRRTAIVRGLLAALRARAASTRAYPGQRRRARARTRRSRSSALERDARGVSAGWRHGSVSERAPAPPDARRPGRAARARRSPRRRRSSGRRPTASAARASPTRSSTPTGGATRSRSSRSRPTPASARRARDLRRSRGAGRRARRAGARDPARDASRRGAHRAGGEIAAVRFASEWLASSAGVAALERALAGAPLDADALPRAHRAACSPTRSTSSSAAGGVEPLVPRACSRRARATARKRDVSGESASSPALSGWTCFARSKSFASSSTLFGSGTQQSTGHTSAHCSVSWNADALRAELRVDHEGLFALADRVVRALGLADAAVDALFGDHRGHRLENPLRARSRRVEEPPRGVNAPSRHGIPTLTRGSSGRARFG